MSEFFSLLSNKVIRLVSYFVFWGRIKTCIPMTVSPAVSVLKSGSWSSISHSAPGFWVFSKQKIYLALGFLIVTYLIHLKRSPSFLACWCLHNIYFLQAFLTPKNCLLKQHNGLNAPEDELLSLLSRPWYLFQTSDPCNAQHPEASLPSFSHQCNN